MTPEATNRRRVRSDPKKQPEIQNWIEGHFWKMCTYDPMMSLSNATRATHTEKEILDRHGGKNLDC